MKTAYRTEMYDPKQRLKFQDELCLVLKAQSEFDKIILKTHMSNILIYLVIYCKCIQSVWGRAK
jgi:hypothetical protein